MDNEIKNLIELARKRGSQYIKRDYSPDEFGEQMAELGVYLLSECDRILALDDRKKRIEKLNELHNKIDNFRQAIFAFKRKIVE